MRRFTLFAELTAAAVLALVLLPMAYATTTWTSSTTQFSARAVCTTGTESAPSAATAGLKLNEVGGLVVHLNSTAAADAGGYVPFSAGWLRGYIYNMVGESWSRAPDIDLPVEAGQTAQSWSGFTVTSPSGRVAFVPDGVGTAVTIDLVGMPPKK